MTTDATVYSDRAQDIGARASIRILIAFNSLAELGEANVERFGDTADGHPPGLALSALKLTDRADCHPGADRERFHRQIALCAQSAHGGAKRRVGR